MATERQIAANRINARKSTGPRSKHAKQRASRNAYRHGLSLSLTSSAAIAKRLDALARKIAGNSKNEVILQHARAAAQAELDLARVRQVKVALIERVSASAHSMPLRFLALWLKASVILNRFCRAG